MCEKAYGYWLFRSGPERVPPRLTTVKGGPADAFAALDAAQLDADRLAGKMEDHRLATSGALMTGVRLIVNRPQRNRDIADQFRPAFRARLGVTG